MYGGLSVLGTPVVRTDAAGIWATGTTWWQIPPISKVEFSGKLLRGVTGKDVIITLCGIFNKDQVLNHAVEFSGPGVANLSINDRLTIANMTTEWGALAGVFEVDNKTIEWLEQRSSPTHPRINPQTIQNLKNSIFTSDKDAFYSKVMKLDLSTVTPHVSGPDHVKKMSSVFDMEKKHIKVNKAYIVSCTNSRTQDLEEAAKVLKGKKIANGVEMYISAASSVVQEECEKSGVWQTLIDAGAKPLVTGCGPCIGLGAGLLQDGEVGISASNRNFKGRMGSRNAIAYLASPAVVASSALNGFVSGPKEVHDLKPIYYYKEFKQQIHSKTVELSQGFPSQIKGDVVFCHQDNLNTDGIYPGKYTYNEAITKEEQANVAMENYDPEFKNLVKPGNVLIGGFNFGSGSSREQAATCLKYKGIPCIIAGSFSETYKRNAINNGYLVIEIPDLVNDLKAKFGDKKLTIMTGEQIVIDFTRSNVTMIGKTYPMSAVGSIAQELILVEGLENWIIKNIEK
jgi:homoaconitate hydratase